MFSPSCFLFGKRGDMLLHNRLHFLGQCSVSPAQSPAPTMKDGCEQSLGVGWGSSHMMVWDVWIDGPSFSQGRTLVPQKQWGFCSFCWSIGEAEMFTHIIVFRVVFEVTFKQLTPFKKRSLPYHTVGIPGGNNSFERFQNYRDIKSTLQLSFSAASCQVTRKLFPKLFSAIALHVQEGATQLKERPLSFFLYSSASFSPNTQSCLFFFFLS